MEGGVPRKQGVALPLFRLIHKEDGWYYLGGNWTTVVAGPHARYLFGNRLGILVPVLDDVVDLFEKNPMFGLSSGRSQGGC